MKINLPFLLIIVLIAACKKEGDSNGDEMPLTQQSSGLLSATVDGVTVYADSAKAFYLIDTIGFPWPQRVFLIKGNCQNKIIWPGFVDTINSFIIPVLSYGTTGAIETASLDYFNGIDSIDDFFPSSAYFDITSVDTANKKVSGHFNGVIVGNGINDTVVITNGVFNNIKYEYLY
jgi:hypothetical protein